MLNDAWHLLGCQTGSNITGWAEGLANRSLQTITSVNQQASKIYMLEFSVFTVLQSKSMKMKGSSWTLVSVKLVWLVKQADLLADLDGAFLKKPPHDNAG